MKKRTRDLLVGTTLAGVGMVGAMAFLVDKSEQKTIYIGKGDNMQAVQVQEVTSTNQNSQIYAGTQSQNVGPAYQTGQSQGNFTNNPNFQNTIPNTPANNYIASTEQAPTSQNHNAQNSQGLCAPEALAVGIKHFRYADADPNDLVPSGYGSDPKFKIHKDAKPALQEMIAAAKRDGVTLTPGSILRTSSRQAQIVNDKKKKGMSAKQIYYTSSHPGYSEHHTGLAVDFSPIDNGFNKTAGYRWLKQHAHEYGWVQTFTEDYARYSGVSPESWHWRYEGKNGEFAHIFEASKNRRC